MSESARETQKSEIFTIVSVEVYVLCVCVCEIPYRMNSSLNRVPENGSEPIESVNVVFAVQRQKHSLNAFDLVKVGLSSTFAIAVFFGIGYVVKHVAGPSTILSVLLAAFIAYLVGKIELYHFPATDFLFLSLSVN